MEFNVNFKIDPLVIKIEVNPQFTQTLAMLAAAFGYPAKTIASELKQTAQEIKAKAEAPKAVEAPKIVEEVKPTTEKWTLDNLAPILSGYLKKHLISKDDITRELKKYKNKNGNPIIGITELCNERSQEDINKFLKTIQELCKEEPKNDSQDG